MTVKYKENKESLLHFFKREVMCLFFLFEAKFVFNGLLLMGVVLKKLILLCTKMPLPSCKLAKCLRHVNTTQQISIAVAIENTCWRIRR